MKSIAECKTEFGSAVHTATFDGVEYAFRKPTRVQWRAYKIASSTAQHLTKDMEGVLSGMEELAKECCLSHDPAELIAEADRNYDLFEQLFDVISDLVVTTSAAEGK